MADLTRNEHVAWCKQRALKYLPGDPEGAFASMSSDLGKHPDTEGHIGIRFGRALMMNGFLSGPDKMREWIVGFN